MSENFDGVYELQVFYTTTPTGFPTMEHKMTVDVHMDADPAVGDLFTGIETRGRNGTLSTLDAVTDALIVALLPFYPSTAEISRAELWQIAEGTYDGVFISAYEIAEAGVGAGGSNVAHQSTFTFRSLNGGHGRIQLMESIDTGNTRQVAPYSSRAAVLAAFIIDADNPFQARDNSFLFANIAYSQGQNERLFRKRFRS